MIAGYGTGVAGAKPSDAIKEMAKQIADRDKSVRNAALNAITETYFQEGEKLYTMIQLVQTAKHAPMMRS